VCPDCRKVIKRASNNQKICFLCRKARLAQAQRVYRKTPEGIAYSKRFRESPTRKAWAAKPETKEKSRRRFRQVKYRHMQLKSAMRREGIPETDYLYRLNFYAEIIKDNACHYCNGTLPPTGASLDRMDNDLGHACYNVVPCCNTCNRKKSNDWSYEEMMLLSSALQEIRLRRASKENL
jgi:hypothetical protein